MTRSESLRGNNCALRYPWERWFDGAVHVLERGVHFEHPVQRFRRQVMCRAHDRGVQVDTLVVGEELVVRARPPLSVVYPSLGAA